LPRRNLRFLKQIFAREAKQSFPLRSDWLSMIWLNKIDKISINWKPLLFDGALYFNILPFFSLLKLFYNLTWDIKFLLMRKQRSDPWKFLPSGAYQFIWFFSICTCTTVYALRACQLSTKKQNSPAVGAVLFAVDILLVFTMMEQNKKYIDRITHFIVCGTTAYFMRLALFVLYGVQLIINNYSPKWR